MISIRMLKLCGDSICQTLEIIFKACLRNGRFPLEGKKANVVPIHKKGDKQRIESYRPVSLWHLDIFASFNFLQLILKS